MRSVLAALIVCWGVNASAYVRSAAEDGTPIRWPLRTVPWVLNEQGSADVPIEAVERAAELSFAEWESPECTDLALPYEGRTPDSEVGYFPNQANANIVVFRRTPEEWPHPSQVIGLTTVTFCSAAGTGCLFKGAILDADIELNDAEFRFTTTAVPLDVRIDVRNTITHEAGHVIGLDHPPVPEATMYAQAPSGERSKISLDQDDIDGVCTIYKLGESDEQYFLSSGREDSDCAACAVTRPHGAGGFPALLAVVGLWGLARRRRP